MDFVNEAFSLCLQGLVAVSVNFLLLRVINTDLADSMMDALTIAVSIFVPLMVSGVSTSYRLASMATKTDLKEAVASQQTALDNAVAKMATKEDLNEAVAKMATKEDFAVLLDTMTKGFEAMNRRFDSLERPYYDQIHGRLHMHREPSPPTMPDTPALPIVDPAAEVIADPNDFFSKMPDHAVAVEEDLAAGEAARQEAVDEAALDAFVGSFVDDIIASAASEVAAERGLRVRSGFPASV
jgi:hypothetical protein